jgi:hypothetical protein
LDCQLTARWLAKTVRAAGMIVDLKNSADLLQSK